MILQPLRPIRAIINQMKKLKPKQTKLILALVLLALGLVTRFAFYGQPKEAVLDEVYFGKFINTYYTHEYYFDIHPPLGKLILAGFAAPFGYQPTSNFDSIGTKYTDNNYQILRFLPTLAGALLPLVIFLLALELGLSPIASFFAGILIVFDNGLATQARFILIDSFLLLFGFSSLLCYLKSRRDKGKLGWLVGAALLAGAAASIKWTGLTFLALIIACEIYSIARHVVSKYVTWRLVVIFVLPAAIYISSFAINFSLLTRTGTGDAFMSPGFQKTLVGSQFRTKDNLGTPNFVGKFFELNQQMLSANQRITASHPYSSKWYSWPFMVRPMAYWTGSDGASIYFFGNPIVWWGTTAGLIIASLLFIARKSWRKKRFLALLLIGYLINLLPFISIGRVMFIYHYMVALIFAILITALLIDQLEDKLIVITVASSLALAGFIFFAPFTYGLPLSPSALPLRVWLPSWR